MVLALWFLDTLSYLDCLPSLAVLKNSLLTADIPRDPSPELQSMLVYLPTVFITSNEYHPTNARCCLLCKHVDRNHFYEPNKFQAIVYSSIKQLGEGWIHLSRNTVA